MKYIRTGQVAARGIIRKALCAALLAGAAMFAGAPADAAETPFIKVISATPPPSGARALCSDYNWACAGSRAGSLSQAQELALVTSVNKQINRSTREVSDQRQYRQAEYWALPTRYGGDCEDFALIKKRDLIRQGMDPSKLLIATVLDTQRNAHAVLVYRSSQGDLVLDNLTNKIKPWTATRYVFLRMQDPQRPGGWVGVSNKS